MSLDTQVALARNTPRGESSHLSRAARQVVPPFLQKLYEIVNDPANEELIKWSDGGDSFYVLNHEKFAREVLGRWFKHQKFASFVRQLNMYGFHKIPHLQQGVLKSDSDTEPWHFEHPNFHRGQPDLLCLIQRKKQPTHGQSDDPTLDMHDTTTTTTAPLSNVTPGHLMDINSIVNGVSAIKRHQQAISAELSALKQSNDALWKEAVAARQRHAKHQDTINRILKFLAGVFGHTDSGSHSPDGSHSPPQVTPRIRQRLLIGAPAAKGKHVDIMEVEDDEADILRNGRTGPLFDADQHATIETPEGSISSPSISDTMSHSEGFTPVSEVLPDSIKSPPIMSSQILSRASSTTPTPRLTNGLTTPTPVQTPSPPATAPSLNNVDAMWQAAIQHMMTTPGQFQRIMQAFANQQSMNSVPTPPDNTLTHANNTAVAAYDPNGTDYARWFNSPTPSTPSTVSPPVLAPDENAPLQLLMDESHRLQKSYQDATEIDADMDMLQSSINSLIQNLGIDPTSLASAPEDPLHASTPGMNGAAHATNGFTTSLPPDSFSHGLNGLDATGGGPDVSHPDYLLDSLLSQIGDGSGAGADGMGMGMDMDMSMSMGGGSGGSGFGGLDYPDITEHYDHSAQIDGTAIENASTEQLTAFLDEATGGVGAGAEAQGATKSPRVGTLGQTHQKRKSDAAEMSLPTPPEGGGTGKKVKRKR